MQDSIEREVTIEAPVERVWSVITEASTSGAGSATRAPRSISGRAAR